MPSSISRKQKTSEAAISFTSSSSSDFWLRRRITSAAVRICWLRAFPTLSVLTTRVIAKKCPRNAQNMVAPRSFDFRWHKPTESHCDCQGIHQVGVLADHTKRELCYSWRMQISSKLHLSKLHLDYNL